MIFRPQASGSRRPMTRPKEWKSGSAVRRQSSGC